MAFLPKFWGTYLAVTAAIIVAICATIMAIKVKTTSGIVFAIIHWIGPIWYYFLVECLHNGGNLCTLLAYLQILFLLFLVVVYILSVASPTTEDDLQNDLDDIDLANI